MAVSSSLSARERELLDNTLGFGLLEAVFGRRSRRFGLGMAIPNGPVAYESKADPVPVEGLERDLLVAVATGAVGWHEAIPYREGETTGLASYSLRLGGRSSPGGGGINTVELIYTADDGTFVVSSRDAPPVPGGATGVDLLEQLIVRGRECTQRLLPARAVVPQRAPHVSEHNVWNANVPGSTLFIPVVDLGQTLLGLLAMVIQNGATIVDELTGGPCGDLEPFFRSRLLDPDKRMPIGELEKYVLSNSAVEAGIMAHNITLAMQAIGLGGWLFTGINPLSLMGAYAEDGITGLGFRFVNACGGTMIPPNPVGIDRVLEGLCPPYVKDMHEAAARFTEWKFGPTGSYSPSVPGPYAKDIRASAEPYSPEMVACIGTVAQHVLETRGRFPGTVPAMYMRQYTQAHHIDLDWYDKYLGEGSYLSRHAEHLARWH